MKEMKLNKPFIAQGAIVVGDVQIGENSSIFYNAVLRGDMAKIIIGKNSNVQDNCTIHNDKDVDCIIGDNVTVGHNAVLHSCEIGNGSLIGMGSIILSGAKIGKNAIVGAGSLVTSKTVVEDGSLYLGSPAKFKRKLTKEEIESNLNNANEYSLLADKYLNSISDDFKYEIKPVVSIDEQQLEQILKLALVCEEYDGSKLKLDRCMLENRISEEINDILCYDGNNLIGYLGLCEIIKGSSEIEATVFVDPEYRNQAVFSKLLLKAKEICSNRKIEKILLIGYQSCEKSGIIAKERAYKVDHNEYAMELKKADWCSSENFNLTFRRAVNRDIKELVFLDMIGFNLSQKEAEGFYKDKTMLECYIAEVNDKPVGSITVAREPDEFIIYGLVVSPMFRKKGYGHEILDYALDIGFSDGFTKARLEVEDHNKVAIKLYRGAGFKIVDKYSYYEIKL